MDNEYKNLVDGVRRCEQQAQMAFYDRFFRPVYQSAAAVVGNRDEAEEIMQDTLLKIFVRPELLNDNPQAMERILRRIATNAAIDTVRKQKNFYTSINEEQVSEPADEDEPADEQPDIDEIRTGIGRLPVGYRSILSLRLFSDMNFADIAARLQLNPSTVRVQYTRGLSRLRNLLNQPQRI